MAKKSPTLQKAKDTTVSLLCSKSFRDTVILMHCESLGNTYYAEGFCAENSFDTPWIDNPHPLQTDLETERAQIACIEGKLTKAQLLRLEALNQRLNYNAWHQWSRGNYDRYCGGLVTLIPYYAP